MILNYFLLSMVSTLAQEKVENMILLTRGKSVMIDSDLAFLYGVPTKRLNEQVKRNKKRFPRDFMFKLTKKEKEEVVAICDHLQNLRFSPVLPYAFTEPGVAMLSSVLNSERAIRVNIQIIRIFIKLREFTSTHKVLAHKLDQLESKVEKHDSEIKSIFEVIRRLMTLPEKPRKKIGLYVE